MFVVLFVTLLFANFAEAIAEARGKAQADSLRKTREETPAKILIDGKVCNISSARLKKGGSTSDLRTAIRFRLMVRLQTRLPLVSAITGGAAPVIREVALRFLVTGGTKVLSDR